MSETEVVADPVIEHELQTGHAGDVTPGEVSVATLTPAVRPASALVEPAADTAVVKQAFAAYTALCDELLDDDDYQTFRSRGQVRSFRKKSGWRKLSVAFGVSVELLARESFRDEDGKITRCEVTVRATAPNGRYMDGLGICAAEEQEHTKPEHDIPATAMTRATNRACSDLFGMGEVSAEEVSDAAQTVDDGDAWCTPEQVAKVRELTAAIPPDLKASVVKNDGKRSTIFDVEVRTADGKVGLLQSQYGPLVERLTNVAGGSSEAAESPSKADPDEAPFQGAGVQPEPDNGKRGYDAWPAKDLADECETNGLPKSGERSKLIGRLRAWNATNRPEGYVEPDERPY